MKVLAIFVLCFALAAALPTPSEVSEIQPEQQPQQQQDSLLSADANTQGDNADRSKRFIFFSKFFYPYPVYAAPVATPVVTPIVTKTKVVAAAPAPVVTYAVKPITYQYTYSVPSFTVVKAAPVVVAAAVQPATYTATVTKTEAVATTAEESSE